MISLESKIKTKNIFKNSPRGVATNWLNFSVMAGAIFALGNPLLDMVVRCGDSHNLLTKYHLKPDGAIELEDWQMPLLDDIQKFDINYTPGGSAQNTCRVLQGECADRPRVATFVGCVGRDKNGEKLVEMVTKCGVNTMYMYDDTEPTGVSADLVHGQLRSLCANIGAAKYFNVNHLHKPQLVEAMTLSRVIYVEGYFLTHSISSALYVADFAYKHNKIFAMNLSAVYICRDYHQQILTLLPYANLIFSNEEEAKTFCQYSSLPVNTPSDMCLQISKLNVQQKIPRTLRLFGENHHRCVIITRGHSPVVVAFGDKVFEVCVPVIDKEKIVDTVGAGDAFVGGFFAQFIREENLQACIESGIRAAVKVIQKQGCSL